MVGSMEEGESHEQTWDFVPEKMGKESGTDSWKCCYLFKNTFIMGNSKCREIV